MKAISILVFAAAAASFSGAASAQFAKPADAIKYRKSTLFAMQQHFARVGNMVNGKVPFNAKQAAEDAALAETLAKLPWAAFGEGTDSGDTKARAEIWMEMDKFKAGADKLQAEMAKLVAASKTGNLDSIKKAFQATAATCKSCHDSYRE